MKIWLSKNSKCICIIVILLTILLIVWPIFKSGFIVTDDGDWMIIRLSAFYQSLRQGQFPVRYLGRLNYNFGYPIANFMYPGFLYIGSLIHVIGIPFSTSIKIIIVGSVLFSAIFIFMWLHKYFRLIPSLLGTLSYILAPYLTYDIYKRGSVGELFGMFSASIVLYAIAAKKYWMITFSTFLLIISHNIMALLFITLIGLYVYVYKYRDAWIGLFTGFGMAAFFWLPALVEQRYIVFDTTVISNPFAYFVYSNMLSLIGILFLFTLVLILIFKKITLKPEFHNTFWVIIFTIFLFLASPLSAPFWVTPLAKFVQFPFRFLAVDLVAGAWLVALAFNTIKNKIILALIIIVLFISGIQNIIHISTSEIENKPEGFYTTNESTTTVANEYMPKWVIQTPTIRTSNQLEILNSNGIIIPKKVNNQKIDVTIELSYPTFIQINKIYYPGWGATIDDQPQQIRYDNPKGLMQIMMPAGKHNLKAEFRETPGRFMADFISVSFLIGFFIYQFMYLKKDENA
jgi:hypothetical protein